MPHCMSGSESRHPDDRMIKTDSPKHLISICRGAICGRTDTKTLLQACLRELGIPFEEDSRKEVFESADRQCRVEIIGCLGACSRYPVVMIDEELVTEADAETLVHLIRKTIQAIDA